MNNAEKNGLLGHSISERLLSLQIILLLFICHIKPSFNLYCKFLVVFTFLLRRDEHAWSCRLYSYIYENISQNAISYYIQSIFTMLLLNKVSYHIGCVDQSSYEIIKIPNFITHRI